MKFLILMAEDPAVWEQATESERAAVMEAHGRFDAAVRERDAMLAGEALDEAASARTLRPGPGGRVVTEGPFAEAAEHLGGFYLIEAETVEAAVELADLLPAGYTVELRPVIDIPDDDYGDRR